MWRRTILPALAVLVIFPLSSFGQDAVDRHQAFLDLSNDEVLMDLSAHPDDEDGSSLALYRMSHGVKTYSVLFTRGEGGQNETGPELYEELGVLRSAETEAAGRILGAEVHFLNFKDFGFSKTATETFRIWGGQREVVRRLVYMIRLLKPDVLFTNHNTIDGHGNHQAVAVAAIAAFDLAADSTAFPEQLRERGLALWQPRKLFFRAFGRGDQTADVANDILDVDSARGRAYIDIAASALAMHRTQGMAGANLRAFTRGRAAYKLMRQNSIYERDSTDFFSGIDLWRDSSLSRLVPLRRQLSSLTEGMDRTELLGRISGISTMVDSARVGVTSPLAARIVGRWHDELRRLAELACGVNATLRLEDPIVVAQEKVRCSLVVESTECTLGAVTVRFEVPDGWAMNESGDTAPEFSDRRVSRSYTLTIGDAPQVTLPKAIAQYATLRHTQNVIAHISYALNGYPLTAEAQAAFDVAPGLTLSVEPQSAGIPLSRVLQGAEFVCIIKNYLPHKTAGRLHVQAPPGWKADQESFTIASEDSEARMSIFVRPPEDAAAGTYHLKFKTDFSSLDVPVRLFDARVANGIRVGVVRSYDNTLEAALGTLGVDFTLVDDREISGGDLAQFSTIVVDIRAYLVRESLQTHFERLLQYVKNGGNLVVMYQRDREWKPEYAPFPFEITGRRVTVEDAPVEILQPEHALFNKPNRITAGDWEGWVQERGLHFPGNVSPAYVRLIATSDPDEPPLTTGYLLAKSGKGSYIYTSLVWYRELKDNVPGAFRCFANMISYSAYR